MTKKTETREGGRQISDILQDFPQRVRTRRGFVLGIFCAALLVAVAFASQFKLNQAMTAFFEKDNKALMEYNWFKYLFGSDEVLVVMFTPDGKNVFAKDHLIKMRDVENSLNAARVKEESTLNRITRVRSIISADQLISTEDTLISRPFIGKSELTNESAEAFKKVAFAHQDWPETYFSRDGQAAMMIVQTTFGSRLAESVDAKIDTSSGGGDDFDFDSESDATGLAPTIDLVPKMEEAQMEEYVPFMADFEKQFEMHGLVKNKDYYIAGNPPMMGFFGAVILNEIGLTMLMAIAIIWVVLTITFRSFSAVVWPTVSLVSSLILLFGIMGASGIEMTFMVNIIVFLLLAVTIATSIHIMSGYTFFLIKGDSIEQAISKTYRKAGVAIILAGLTTALGLLSLTIVPIPAIRNFAIFASSGVILSLCLNLVMWPVFLSLWAPKIKQKQMDQKGALTRFLATQGERTHKYRWIIVLTFLLSFLGVGYGVKLVQIDSNFIKMIRSGLGFTEAYTIIDDKFGGTASMEILVDTKVQDGVKNAALLSAVDSLEDELEEKFSLITKVTSLATATKESNKSLHGGSPDYYKIPEDNQGVAHVLFNFESADPDSRKLMVDDNWQILRLNIGMKTTGSIEYIKLFEEVQNLVEDRIAGASKAVDVGLVYSGNIPLMMGLVELISISQIQSFAIALGVICIVMFIVFRSFKLGLIATIPNIFPLAIVMGYAGWTGIPLDSDTLLVVPIAIGIAVDDTIHFLMHFRSEMKDGHSVEDSIRNSLNKVGRAMFFTTVVLSLGFSVYLGSVYNPFVNFGFMSAMAVSSALLADLFLLPVLLRVIYRNHDAKMNVAPATAVGALLIALVSFPENSFAMSADEIGNKMLNRDEGKSQYTSSIVISCSYKEKAGKRSCASSKRKKVIEGVSALVESGILKKGINIIREPASDKGIAFLQQDFEKETKDSLQWIYLPSIRKVKRIVSAENDTPKTGTLFGSEIAYEDIEKTFVKDFSFKLLGEETMKGRKVWKLESKPSANRAPKSSYSRSVQWVDQESFVPLKSELFDRQDKLAKSFFFMDLQKIEGVWLTKRMVVVNHKSKRMSMMKTKEIKVNIDVPEQLLSQKALNDKSFREQLLQKIR